MALFWKIVVYLLLIIGLFVVLTPFVYMVLTSFTQDTFSLPHPDELLKEEKSFHNYTEAWNKNNFQRYFLNSLFVASTTTVFALFFSSMTAYAFARFQFPLKEFLFRLFLFTMMVPGVLNIVPQFTVIKGLGLVDTYRGLLLLYVGTGIAGNTFFLRGFFERIPKELEESVIIDGGGKWTIYRHIYLPLSKPSLATLGIFAFSGAWDEFFVALTILKSEAKRTLPIALQLFQGQHATKWGLVFAASLIAIIPIILIFIVFQKKFVQSTTGEGAVKG
ncbi:carbohydrate ABC transporter permease [Tepidibacillus infernus]|uniref:carbohydrate ABC transporter permease n=1 Tax=Tepidibacillus infernus TaxID=1806172 RepID=UPI003B6B814F